MPRDRFWDEHRIVSLALVPLVFSIFGTIGFRVIEDWSWFDSFYMVVITMTTIGFAEVHPLSPNGRLFTIALASGGVFVLFFAGTEIVRHVISGELRRELGRKRMDKKIAALSGHVVLCGHGRMGQEVAAELSRSKTDFVVIEKKAPALGGPELPHAHLLMGDATSDDVLKAAGIERATTLISALASDADNVYVTMSARLLNPKLSIVARAEEREAVTKLMRAGATRVVSPYVIAGQRVVQAVLRPAVLDFIEVATRSEHIDLQIEEVRVAEGSRLARQTIGETRLRSEAGLIVVALKQASGHMVFNLSDDQKLEKGDTLIVTGPRLELEKALTLVGRGVSSII